MKGSSEAPLGLLRLVGGQTSDPLRGEVVRERFSVPVEYPVVFERDCLAEGAEGIEWAITRFEPDEVQRVFVAVDSGVVQATPGFVDRLSEYFRTRGPRLALVQAPEVLPGGEAAKADFSLVSRLHQTWLMAKLDRHCVVLAIGGGAFLDAVGFAAATFHRGLRLVRVPTTVLAQNDAGLGVKNGLNAHGQKNLVGTFAAPFAVVCDSAFLKTLAPRDLRAGMAEAVKVALIRDRSFFEWLEEHVSELARFEINELEELIRRAAEQHLAHIAKSGDPFESGSARPLDFGHWVAHKLEVLTEHELRHGEAVAIGLAMDSLLSVELGFLAPRTAQRVVDLLRGLGFTLFHPVLVQRSAGQLVVLEGLEEFRQHMGGPLTLPMLQELGQSREVMALAASQVERAVAELARLGTDA